jgi:hypothetical protein
MKLTAALLGFFTVGIFTTAYGQAINFGYGATNTGTETMPFTFTFPMPANELPINLAPGTYDVTSTFGITLTASPGDTAEFSLAPDTSFYMTPTINGVNVASVDIGTTPETTTTTEEFSFPAETSTFTLTSTGTVMSVTTTFDLSPGDSASFSGSFLVTSAPEPRSLVLGGIALVAFALMATRLRRSRGAVEVK